MDDIDTRLQRAVQDRSEAAVVLNNAQLSLASASSAFHQANAAFAKATQDYLWARLEKEWGLTPGQQVTFREGEGLKGANFAVSAVHELHGQLYIQGIHSSALYTADMLVPIVQ